jgi:hypothetical protein
MTRQVCASTPVDKSRDFDDDGKSGLGIDEAVELIDALLIIPRDSHHVFRILSAQRLFSLVSA